VAGRETKTQAGGWVYPQTTPESRADGTVYDTMRKNRSRFGRFRKQRSEAEAQSKEKAQTDGAVKKERRRQSRRELLRAKKSQLKKNEAGKRTPPSPKSERRTTTDEGVAKETTRDDDRRDRDNKEKTAICTSTKEAGRGKGERRRPQYTRDVRLNLVVREHGQKPERKVYSPGREDSTGRDFYTECESDEEEEFETTPDTRGVTWGWPLSSNDDEVQSLTDRMHRRPAKAHTAAERKASGMKEMQRALRDTKSSEIGEKKTDADRREDERQERRERLAHTAAMKHGELISMPVRCGARRDQLSVWTATADTGAESTIVGVDCARIMRLRLMSAAGHGELIMANGMRFPRQMQAILSIVTPQGTLIHRLVEVLDVPFDIILGQDVLPDLGIRLTNLPLVAPRLKDEQYDMTDEESDEDDEFQFMTEVTNRHPDEDIGKQQLVIDGSEMETEERNQVRAAAAPGMRYNREECDKSKPCSHPCAEIDIKTSDDGMTYTPQRQVADAKKPLVSEQFEKFYAYNFIEPANPRNNANIAINAIWKPKEGNPFAAVRICYDFRMLNAKIINKLYDNIPTRDRTIERVRGFKCLSTLDLTIGFQQIRLKEEDRDKTTFRYGSKTWRSKTCPLGLVHVSGEFQSIMETIFASCADFISIYVDDIIIFSNSVEEHCEHIKRVLEIVNKNNLILSPGKCKFGYEEVAFLGHRVGRGKVTADPAKLEGVQKMAAPTSAKEVQRVMGKLQYLSGYVPHFSTIAQPISRLRGNSTKKWTDGEWSKECEQAFITLKKAIAYNLKLCSPTGKPLHVAVDASKYGLGAILYELDDDGVTKNVVEVASKALNKTQVNWGASKREMAALVFGLQRFRHYIDGVDGVSVFTDHAALTHLLTSQKLSSTLMDWLHLIMQYKFTLTHVPGIDNHLPDMLSRLLIKEVPAFEEHQRERSAELAQRASEPKEVHVMRLQHDWENTIIDSKEFVDMVAAVSDKIVPTTAAEKRRLLTEAHAGCHKGAEFLCKTVFKQGHWWPKMMNDAKVIAGQCTRCLQTIVGQKGWAPARSLTADLPMQHCAIDLAVFNRPTRQGNRVALIYTCILTGFTLLRALPDKKATTVATAIHSCMAVMGHPHFLNSDNGAEFKNKHLKLAMKAGNIDQRHLCPYAPSGNGAAERKVGSMKKMLRALRGADGIDNFDELLDTVQYAMNITTRAGQSMSPFEMVYARSPGPKATSAGSEEVLRQHDGKVSQKDLQERNRLMSEILFPRLAEARRQEKDVQNSRMNKRNKVVPSDHVRVGATVYRKNDNKKGARDDSWLGPYLVTERTEFDTYRLFDPVAEEYHRRRVPVNKLKVLSDDDTLPSERRVGEKLGAIEVETITAKRTLDDGGIEYKIKWLGHHSDQSTWQPAGTLNNAKDEVKDFETRDKARVKLQAQLLDERQQAYKRNDELLQAKEERIRKKIQDFVSQQRPGEGIVIDDQLDAYHKCFKPSAKFSCGTKKKWLDLVEEGTLANMVVPTGDNAEMGRRQSGRTKHT
jgi:hypothetical protein